MEVVLDKEDLETLIRDSYDGVEEVSFDKDSPKATLTVDLKQFSLKKQKTSTETKSSTGSKKKDGLTTEQRLELTNTPGGIKAATSGGNDEDDDKEPTEEQQKTVEEMQEERRKRLEAQGKIMSSGASERNRVLRQF